MECSAWSSRTSFPGSCSTKVPAETIYSQIGHVLEQYRADAQRLVALTCGQSERIRRRATPSRAPGEIAGDLPSFVSVGTVRQVGRVQGKVVQVGLEAGWVSGSEPLLAFYQDQIEPYLEGEIGDAARPRLARSKPSRCLRRSRSAWTPMPIPW